MSARISVRCRSSNWAGAGRDAEEIVINEYLVGGITATRKDVWEAVIISTGTSVHVLTGPAAAAMDVAFSPDGTLLCLRLVGWSSSGMGHGHLGSCAHTQRSHCWRVDHRAFV